jgi:hypothetical protein
MRIALATCDQFPELYDDDRPLVSALAARGIEAAPRVWNDPAVAWDDYPLVVCRSPWDYHRHAPAFLAWIDRVAAKSAMVNAPAILKWNAHKGYLRDLEARGVAMVPTAWCPLGEPADLVAILEQRGWRDAVVKPAVSAGANDTLRVRVEEPSRIQQGAALLASLVRRGDALVQPYLATVEGHGERSLLHFDGVFSHAVRKHALLAPGAVDPLAQGEGVPRVDASDAELAFASRVLAAAADATGVAPAYARVDVAPAPDGGPLLMELEVLEPCLFLRAGAAHDRFADVLAAAARALPARAP